MKTDTHLIVNVDDAFVSKPQFSIYRVGLETHVDMKEWKIIVDIF